MHNHSWPKLATVPFERLLPGDVYYGSLIVGEPKTRDFWVVGREIKGIELARVGFSNHTVTFMDGSHDLPWKSASAIIQDRRRGVWNAVR